MSKIKRVNFLMNFDGPKLLGPIGIDVILVVMGTFIAIFTMCTVSSVRISITLILSFGLTYLVTRTYNKACELSSNGYFRQFLYMTGVWSVRADPEKFKELKNMDIKNYMPEATDKLFVD